MLFDPRRSAFALAIVLPWLCPAMLSAETTLLDFRADWCGPCRSMDPVVRELAAEGYPVQAVDIDRQPELARRYQIDGVPTFLVLVDGREVERVSGVQSKGRLVQMLRRGTPPEATATVRQSRSPTVDPLVAASARLVIEDTNGRSTGSGTVIDAREGEALILTCGHVFREFRPDGAIKVDLFAPGAPQGLLGKLVSYDLKSDVGLVRVEADFEFVAARVAPAGAVSRVGERVVSVGCDGGADATPRATEITSVNRFNHAPNVQVGFQPVQGRSGGGLFNAAGQVIGVCNAADPAENQGLFASTAAIQAELDRAKLSFVYRPWEGTLAAWEKPSTTAEPQPQGADSLNTAGERGVSIGATSGRERQPVATRHAVQEHLTADEQALLMELQGSDQADVIMIVQANGTTNVKSRVLQLNKASPEFWKQLAASRTPHLTSLENRGTATAQNGARGPATAERLLPPRPQFSRAATSAASDRIWPAVR